jgi:branched-chain amino acid aminotransferase
VGEDGPVSDQGVHGVHEYEDDPRNEDVLVYVNGELRPRGQAVVSVFDAGFVLGDGVWEGLRVHGGHPVFLDRHLDRLAEGAKALALDIGRTRAELRDAVYTTLRANGMTDGVHVRLMVTRGVKRTPYQDPRLTVGPATLVIVPEHKVPSPAVAAAGIRLFTVHVRRPYPDVVDPKLNTHSKLNDITACIQAYTAGADEALMLDPNGFVSSCNATNFFMVRDGAVWTSTGEYCFKGVTRSHVVALCRDHGIPVRLQNFTLNEVYGAEEAFVTGTFGGVTPVREVDGRALPTALPGPVTARLRDLYERLKDDEASR